MTDQALKDSIKDAIVRIWDKGGHPHIIVKVQGQAWNGIAYQGHRELQLANLGTPKNNEMVFNLSPLAIQDFSLEDMQYFGKNWTCMRFKARFSQVVTSLVIPLENLSAIYDKQTGEVCWHKLAKDVPVGAPGSILTIPASSIKDNLSKFINHCHELDITPIGTFSSGGVTEEIVFSKFYRVIETQGHNGETIWTMKTQDGQLMTWSTDPSSAEYSMSSHSYESNLIQLYAAPRTSGSLIPFMIDDNMNLAIFEPDLQTQMSGSLPIDFTESDGRLENIKVVVEEPSSTTPATGIVIPPSEVSRRLTAIITAAVVKHGSAVVYLNGHEFVVDMDTKITLTVKPTAEGDVKVFSVYTPAGGENPVAEWSENEPISGSIILTEGRSKIYFNGSGHGLPRGMLISDPLIVDALVNGSGVPKEFVVTTPGPISTTGKSNIVPFKKP